MIIEINGHEYYAECEYEHIRGYEATRLDPAEPSNVEITRVMLDYGTSAKHDLRVIDLPEEVISNLEDEILEEIEG